MSEVPLYMHSLGPRHKVCTTRTYVFLKTLSYVGDMTGRLPDNIFGALVLFITLTSFMSFRFFEPPT